MKKLFILILLVVFAVYSRAEKLKNSTWSIVKVECSVIAEDVSRQLFLDSLSRTFQQKMIAPADQYVYKFTTDELIRKTKGKESYWKYKESDNNLVVDMGKGIVLIQRFEIKKDTLILEMDKSLFFLSEFGQKMDTIKLMVKDLSLRYYYRKN